MTKMEMVQEIISGTTLGNMPNRIWKQKVSRMSKDSIERIYNHYLEFPQNANGLALILFWN